MPRPKIKLNHTITPTRLRTEVAWRFVVLNKAAKTTLQTSYEIAALAKVSRRTVMNMRAVLAEIGLTKARKLSWFDAAQLATTNPEA